MSGVIEQPRYACALSAQQTVLAIPKAHPILHSGPGCSEKATGFLVNGGGFQGEGYSGGAHVSCTNSSQKEIIFGGEKKLRSTIEGALKVIDADLYVVLTGCTADIVGDDTIGIAKEYAEQGYPIVGTETAGFKGNGYYGFHQVVKQIIDQYVGNVKPNVRKGVVNVFSVVPYQDPNWQEDLIIIKDLLSKLGFEVNILFGVGSKGVSEWKDIPNAEFNILISPWVGKEIVKHLEKKYGTPYFSYPYLPVGAKQTSDFLRKLGEYAGIDTNKVEEVISEEEKVYYNYFESIAGFTESYREDLPYLYALVADSNYALGASDFLTEELGMIPQGIYITDDVKESLHEEIAGHLLSKNEIYKDRIFFEPDGGSVQKNIKEHFDDEKELSSDKVLLVGSTWERYLADATNNRYIPLSLPLTHSVVLNRSYAGYRGGINLIREITNLVF